MGIEVWLRTRAAWFAAVAVVGLCGCGGGGGGGSAANPGEPGEPPAGVPANTQQAVAQWMQTSFPREKREKIFGQDTDAIEAAWEQQLALAREAADSALRDILQGGSTQASARRAATGTSASDKAVVRRASSRHTDPGMTPPHFTGSKTVEIPNLKPFNVGPYTLTPAGTVTVRGEDHEIGMTVKFTVTTAAKVLGIDVHANLLLQNDAELDLCPEPNGIDNGKDTIILRLNATASEPGFHSLEAEMRGDRTMKLHVNDSANYTTLDTHVDYTGYIDFDGLRAERKASADVNNVNPAKLLDFSFNDIVVKVQDNQGGSLEELAFKALSAATTFLQGFQTNFVANVAQEHWRNGGCVEVVHANPDVTHPLRVGEVVEVDVETRSKDTNAIISPVKYTTNLPATVVQEASPGKFKVTVPARTSAEWKKLGQEGLVVTSTSKRGINTLTTKWQLDGLHIDMAFVVEDTGELILLGTFGSTKGEVKVLGTPLSVKTWADKQVVAAIPSTGSASAGVVQAFADGAESNTMLLTEWKGKVTYTLRAAGDLSQVFEQDLRFRADARQAAFLNTFVHAVTTRETKGTFHAAGNYNTTVSGCDYSLLWTGNASLPWASTPGGDFFHFAEARIDPLKNRFGLHIGAGASALRVVQTVTCSPNPPQTSTADGKLAAIEKLTSMTDKEGWIQLPMNDSYYVPAGQKSITVSYPIVKPDDTATITVSWSAFTTRYAPGQ